MSNIWKEQTLATAFEQKAKSLGIKLFPETALDLAKEVKAEAGNDKVSPLGYLVKKKADELFNNDSQKTANVISTLEKVAKSFNEIMTRFADDSAAGDLTQQELDDFFNQLHQRVIIPFKQLGPVMAAKTRVAMENLKKADQRIAIVQAAFDQTRAEADSAYDEWQADPTNADKKQIYRIHLLSLKKDAIKIAKLKLNFSLAQSAIIFLHATGNPITRAGNVSAQHSVSGASNMIKELGIDIGDIKDSIKILRTTVDKIRAKQNVLEGKKDPFKLNIPSRSGKETHNLIDVLRQQTRSPGSEVESQESILDPGKATIDINDYLKSDGFEIDKLQAATDVRIANPNATQDDVDAAMEKIKIKRQTQLSSINNIDNTWQKFREIYEILDPMTSKSRNALDTIKINSPQYGMDPEEDIKLSKAEIAEMGSRWKTLTKKRAAGWSKDDIEFSNRYLSTANNRSWGERRKMAEAMNPSAHWSTLFGIANMNAAVDRDEKGESAGQILIESIKKSGIEIDEKDAKELASKADDQMWTQRRNAALQVALNPGTPDWILMYLAQVFPEGVLSPIGKRATNVRTEFRIIREVANEMLLERGWKLKIGPDGKPEESQAGGDDYEIDKVTKKTRLVERKGTYGYIYERIPGFDQAKASQAQTSASYKNKTVVAQSDEMSNIDRQIDAEQTQVETLKNQINQHQQRINTLNNNKKPLMDQQKRSQEAAANQQAAAVSAPSGVPGPGAVSSAKYKVIYKKAAKY